MRRWRHKDTKSLLKHLQKGEYLVFQEKSFEWNQAELEMWLFFKGVGCEHRIQHQALISEGFLPGNLWLPHPKSIKKYCNFKIFQYLKATSVLRHGLSLWDSAGKGKGAAGEGTGTSPRCPCPTKKGLWGTDQSLPFSKLVHLGIPAL